MGAFLAVPFVIYGGFVDWKKRIVPNLVPLSLLICGVIDLFLPVLFKAAGLSFHINEITGVGKFFGFLIPLIFLSVLYFVKRPLSGGGDLKLVPALGFCTGVYGLIVILLFAAIGGLIHFIITKDKYIPLATYAAVGTTLNMFFCLSNVF